MGHRDLCRALASFVDEAAHSVLGPKEVRKSSSHLMSLWSESKMLWLSLPVWIGTTRTWSFAFTAVLMWLSKKPSATTIFSCGPLSHWPAKALWDRRSFLPAVFFPTRASHENHENVDLYFLESDGCKKSSKSDLWYISPQAYCHLTTMWVRLNIGCHKIAPIISIFAKNETNPLFSTLHLTSCCFLTNGVSCRVTLRFRLSRTSPSTDWDKRPHLGSRGTRGGHGISPVPKEGGKQQKSK